MGTAADVARLKGFTEIAELVESSNESQENNIALALYPYNEEILKDQHQKGDLSFTPGCVYRY